MKTSCQSSYSDFKDHVVIIMRVLGKCDVDESSDLDMILARIDSYELSQVLSKEFYVRIIPDEICSCRNLLDLINILFLKKILKRECLYFLHHLHFFRHKPEIGNKIIPRFVKNHFLNQNRQSQENHQIRSQEVQNPQFQNNYLQPFFHLSLQPQVQDKVLHSFLFFYKDFLFFLTYQDCPHQ